MSGIESMSEWHNPFVRLYLARRFTVMLLALMGLMLLRITDMELHASTPLPDLAGGVVLVAAGLSMCEHRRMRAVAIGLGLPTLVLVASAAFQIRDDSHWLQAGARAASALYMGLITIAILQGLLRQTQVSSETLIGAFCGYLLIAALMRSLDSFKLFDKVLAMTGGGPGNATETLSLHVHRLAFRFFDIGMASAAAAVMVAIAALLAVLYARHLLRAEGM